MNRKERRFAEKAQEKKTGFKPAPASAVTKAEILKAEGMALRAAGKEAEAIPLLAEALKLNSALADVHFILAIMARTKPELNVDMAAINRGIKNKIELKEAYKAIQDILRSRKQRAENLICQEEICRLLPEDNDEKAEYALMLNLAERKEEALRVIANLLDKNPANKTYKGIFIGFLDHVVLNQFDPVLKKALQRCFDNIYEANLYKALHLWLNIIFYDPASAGLKDLATITNDADFDRWMNSATEEQLGFAQDRFFLSGLRLLIISSPVAETIMIRLRRWLCLNFKNLATEGRIKFFEPLIYALAEQSFFNEYIYPQSDPEKDVINHLINGIKGGAETESVYGLIACYEQLYKTFPDGQAELQELADQSPNFAKLFKTQFLDIAEERALKNSLATFGAFENDVSKNVQAQYEENPYPRWVSCVNFPSPNNTLPMAETQRFNPWNILVAGCGTGRHAMFTAATFPKAQVTAIDISRASLAYAQRKANESGLANRIKFIHADILNMDKWPDQFDIIESSGVLHHMEDPFKGWQTLCDRLKPGGYFKIGLYSEMARTEVVKARNFIKNKGFESTLEGIRSARAEIMNLPTSDPHREWMINTGDFYTTSSLRDLIFHVQEHRMTLPQIQDMLDRLSLVPIKFLITDINIANRYDTQFPGDPARKNLSNWHQYEQKYPETFRAMYQFWSQKQ